MNKFMEKVWIKLAWLMPRDLVKWCAVRLMASGTVGKYENQLVSELTCLEALNRWEQK